MAQKLKMENIISEKTYHYVYKTTNLINNKIYIGKHSTNNLEDGYIGSGTYILIAIKKHGIENFKKEILEFFDSPENALEFESEVVNSKFIRRRDNYNMCLGGSGSWAGTVITKNKFGNTFQVSVDDERYLSGELVSIAKGTVLVRDKTGNIFRVSVNDPRYLSGELVHNSSGVPSKCKGRITITNGKEEKMIDPKESIPLGFWRGRKARSWISVSGNKGKTCINNGKVNKYINLEKQEMPKGFRKGDRTNI